MGVSLSVVLSVAGMPGAAFCAGGRDSTARQSGGKGARPGTGKPPGKPSMLTPEARYQAALAAFQAGDRERARQLFSSVLAELPRQHPLFAKTLYNIAYVADADAVAGEVDAACIAEAAYERYLNAAPDDDEHEATRRAALDRRTDLAALCEPPLRETPPREPPTGPGADIVVSEPSAAHPRPGWLLPASLAGSIGFAAIGAGTYFWARSDLDRRQDAYEQYLIVSDRGAASRQKRATEAAGDDAERHALASSIAFGVAGVLAATTAWLFFTSPDDTPEMSNGTGQGLSVGLVPGGAILTW